MKKNFLCKRRGERLKRLFRFMKFSFILIFITALQLSAGESSQKTLLSLKLKDANIEKAFNEISSVSDFIFFYSNDEITSEENVSVHASNVTIDELLDKVLSNTNLSYNIVDNYVVISPKKESAEVVLFQQQQVITGKVLSISDKMGLPGVNVYFKELPTRGTVTDIDGNFTINVPPEGKTLVFSMVGFEDKEVVIENQTEVTVYLEEEFSSLDEVVVIAYGTQRRGEITGALSTVSAEKISSMPVESVDKTLQGNVAGVFVSSESGVPGSTPVIRVRGISSLTAGNDPLYVIDGVPVINGNFSSWRDGGVLSSISNSDIQSVSVLKDAAAMAIYGSRAANGVILITTKSGKEGKTKYNFTAKYGISQRPNSDYYKLSAAEELEIKREGVANANALGRTALTPDDVYPMSMLDRGGTDWVDLLYRDGATQEYMFNASGGNEKTKFYSSMSYYNQEGIVLNSAMERFTGRLNLDHKASDFFSFGFQSSVSKTNTDNIETWHLGWENPVAAAMWNPSIREVYTEDGEYTAIPEIGGKNTISFLDNTTRGSDAWRIMTNGYIDFQFVEGLHLKTEGAIDLYTSDDIEIYSTEPTATWWPTGQHYESKRTTTKYNYKNLLTYDKTFASRHNLNFLLGFEAEKYKFNDMWGIAQGIDPLLPYFIAGMTDLQVESYDQENSYMAILSRVSYNFDDKYFFSASFRRDGSSRFGVNNRWANFGAVSAAWRLSKESFMANLGWLNDLKIRTSYGTSGNSNIDDYLSRGTYFVSAYNRASALLPFAPDNPNLTWEKNKQFDIGVDFGILNRFSGSLDLFSRTSSDMLLEVPLSATTGFKDATRNTASMVNKGFELEFRSLNVNGTFKWETNINLGYTQNEITDLPAGNILYGTTSHIIGQDASILTPYAYAGVNPANGQELYWNITYEQDANGNPDYTKEISRELTNDPGQASRQIHGKFNPDWTGGVGNTFSYKGLELYFNFNFVAGREVLVEANKYVNHDGRSNYGLTSIALRRWQKPGDITDVPMYLYNNPQTYLWESDRFMNSGDYLRLKTVSLSYNLPQSVLNRIKVASAQIYVQGSNLYTFHKVDAFDPDRRSYRGFAYPNPRTVTMGINLGF